MNPPRPSESATKRELWAWIKHLELQLAEQAKAHTRQLEDIADMLGDLGIGGLSARS